MYIASGNSHTVLVSENGQHIWTFGNNNCGQLRHDDMENRYVPTEIQRGEYGLHKDVRIIGASCGGYHTVLLFDDCSIWQFGSNYYQQIWNDRKGTAQRFLEKEGIKIVKISCGKWHTVLLFDDGRVWTFGDNTYGQLGHGNVLNMRGRLKLPEDVKIVNVNCGTFHTVLLSDDGRIWTFGDNRCGQLGHGDMENRYMPTEIQRGVGGLPEDVRIVDVSCGAYHTVLLSDDGRIWTFGSNANGQLGLGMGDRGYRNVPTEIQRRENGLPKDVKIIDASCGESHTVLLSDDGRIWTFGNNYAGQLGHGDNEDRNVPTEIPRGENGLHKDVRIIGVSCGNNHTVLLSDDGRVWTFGNNNAGQLGNGDSSYSKNINIPTEIQDFSLRQFGSLTKSANKS